jgi:hypothetical protein
MVTDNSLRSPLIPTEKTIPILQRARDEGYREGWSQASMIAYDDAVERGRIEAEKYAPRRKRWFVLGVFAAIAIIILLDKFKTLIG